MSTTAWPRCAADCTAACLSGNPALHLFVPTLTDLTQRQPVFERSRLSLEDIHAAHAMIAEGRSEGRIERRREAAEPVA